MLKFDFKTFMNVNSDDDYNDLIHEIRNKLEKKSLCLIGLM